MPSFLMSVAWKEALGAFVDVNKSLLPGWRAETSVVLLFVVRDAL